MRVTETSKTVLRLAAQGHLIGEGWVVRDAGGTHHHRNPATGEVQADVGLDDGTGIDDAVRAAIGRASATLHNLDWFEVTDTRGRIEEDGIHFQVTLKVGFRLDEPPA